MVLLDLKLPHVLGLDVLKWIRSNTELTGVIVVILTSSKENSDIERAYSLGANSYLVKPSGTQGLSQMVKAIKEYWLNLNQLLPQRAGVEHGWVAVH